MLAPEGLRNEGALQGSQGSRLRSACRFVASVMVSGVVSWALARALRRPLDVRTDIVGHPIFANFNGFNYYTQYYFAILCFPLLALLLYALIGQAWRGSDWPELAHPSVEVAFPRPIAVLVGALPDLAVGSCFGTAWLLSSDSEARWLLLVPVGTALVYAGLLRGVERLATTPLGRERTALPSLVNACVAPFTLLLLLEASRQTWVAIEQPPSIEWYAPVPGVLVLVLLALTIAWTVVRLRRASTPSELRKLALHIVLLIVVPVLLATYTASIPRPLAVVDFFHHGELVGGANLVSRGAFPWRDLIFIHGLLQDVLIPWLGFVTFDRTIWGATAGFDFWAAPAWWLAYYALFAYLFRRRPLLLVAALAVPFTGAYLLVHHRFVPYPIILLALAAVLRKPSWWAASGLAASLLVGNLLTPELAYAVLATGVVLICYEWSRKERNPRVRDRLVGTRRVALAGGVLALCWCAFLYRHAALGAFFDYYRTFAPGHRLTGAIPILPSEYADPYFVKLMLLPPLTVVLMFWYLASRWRQRIALEERDWVMLAATLVTAVYYSKFLSRADWHVAHTAAAALPLAFFLADRGLAAIEGMVTARWRPWVPVLGGAAILAWVIQSSPPGFIAHQGQLGSRFHFAVEGRPEVAGFGWSSPRLQPVIQEVAKLRSFVQREVRLDEPIFDFTNQPALYHFLLDLKPATRFLHVSMAIRRRSQAQLIQDLQRTRPRLVVYQTDHGGLPEWDGVTNVVRHYDVSRYILNHYVPLNTVAGQTFYVLREHSRSRLSPGEAATEKAGQRCDWGYAPFHLEGEGLEVGPAGRIIAAGSAVRLAASGWAALSGGAGPVAEIIAVSGGFVRARATPEEYRADVVQAHGDGAGKSGFTMFGEWDRAGEDRLQVTLLALGEGGVAGVLGQAGATGSSSLRLPEELRDVRVAPGSTIGNLESLELANESVLQVEFPPEVRVSELAGLELEVRAIRPGSVAISAVPPERVNDERTAARESRGVAVRVPRTEGVRVRIPADNCPSLRGSDGSTLFLRSDEGVEVRGVRALRRPR